MSLYEEWVSFAEGEDSPQKAVVYNNYIEKETEIYKLLLGSWDSPAEKGTFVELASKYDTDELIFTGFLDGIKESLKVEPDMENLTADSEIELDIDYEKLYFNMHKAKAKWLYTLDEWESVLDKDARARILSEYKSTIIAKSDKVGRNDPCTSGSGKKYKNCCGGN